MAIDIHTIESGRIRKTITWRTGSRRCCSYAHEVKHHFLEKGLTMSTNGKPGIVFAHGLWLTARVTAGHPALQAEGYQSSRHRTALTHSRATSPLFTVRWAE